jgi:hypothetical protein
MNDEPPTVRVIRVYDSGEWSYEHRRPNVPVLGIFLLALGGLLLIDQVVPGALDLAVAGAGAAIGALFLVSWFRGGWGLYPGILLVALSLPGLLEQAGLVAPRDGYSTLLLGVGLLAVAIARVRDRRGFGWQGFFGVIFALFGGASVAGYQEVGGLVWAALLIAIGAIVLLRR